ncbi:MAG TPA: flagellar basal body rod protein FlgC [Bryobacteraceae bacterium]|jgi:flagellar basal-body rod protein FlgC|nr:flagellar basal body rod protein FlgC [Bryobacteraceae bacterium]
MSLLSALSVSASGMAAQRTRAELVVENLANAETTRTPEGGAYRRKDAVFTSAPQVSAFGAVFQTEMGEGINGVQVSDVIEDTAEPDKRYIPGHPDADKDGYVAFPRINPAEEMVDLLSAQRGYEGNIAAMTAVKDMIMRSISLLS